MELWTSTRRMEKDGACYSTLLTKKKSVERAEKSLRPFHCQKVCERAPNSILLYILFRLTEGAEASAQNQSQ